MIDIKIKAIIHDAVIFSCKKDIYKKIEKLNFLTDPITNISIPVKLKILSANMN